MKIIISKDKTTILKGIAILFMILHHVFIKEFYINPPEILSSLPAIRIQIAMKMCVGIYTFFIGYGFWFCSMYGAKYVSTHIGKLLKQYWIVFAILILPISYWGGYLLDVKRLALNLFGLEHQYCLGNWYIYFYAYALLVLPLLKWWLQPKGLWRLITAVVLFAVLRNLYSDISYCDNCFAYTQILAIGIYSAKTQILTKWSAKINSRLIWFVLALFAVFIRCYSGAMGFTTDVVAVPLLVISVCGLSQGHERSCSFKVLTNLGKCSTYMWFIHCVFFSDATRNLFQCLPIWNNSSLLVFFIVTIASYILAFLFNKAELIIQEKIKLNDYGNRSKRS